MRILILSLLSILYLKPVFASPPEKDQIICPVMKQPVNDTKTAPKSEYKGKTYYFCCPACKPKFDKDPEKYIQDEHKK